jgi:hypothetical protein
VGDLIIALSVIAYAFVLYHKWQAGRARKRLLKLLEAQNAGVSPAVPPPAGEDAAAPR